MKNAIESKRQDMPARLASATSIRRTSFRSLLCGQFLLGDCDWRPVCASSVSTLHLLREQRGRRRTTEKTRIVGNIVLCVCDSPPHVCGRSESRRGDPTLALWLEIDLPQFCMNLSNINSHSESGTLRYVRALVSPCVLVRVRHTQSESGTLRYVRALVSPCVLVRVKHTQVLNVGQNDTRSGMVMHDTNEN
uniref:Uncharacterized protein n=1 Tax=Timema tahoe TaxID=61484 RepID=A0A7R9FGB4_9NEOP|nr:unnamed protein product [Timema tahoe]